MGYSYCQNTSCGGFPKFINKFGLDPQYSALSTDESRFTGLCVINKNSPQQGYTKPFQHPTWDDFGTLATIIRDPQGNCYVYPLPTVNTITNDPLKQNILLRVDSESGVLAPYMEFKTGEKNKFQNPFGLMGLCYDCKNNTMYASSVYNSDRKNEKSIIYHFDPETKQVIDELPNIDAIGLYVLDINGEKKLLIGRARTSDVYSITIDSNGKFIGTPKLEFTIDDLGLRGDDKVNKFQIDPQNGDLIVFGVEFYFNLIAPSKDQAGAYRFRYNATQKKWNFISVER